jgi:hypothetical protein
MRTNPEKKPLLRDWGFAIASIVLEPSTEFVAAWQVARVPLVAVTRREVEIQRARLVERAPKPAEMLQSGIKLNSISEENRPPCVW